jgi:hypothetical protein
MAAATKQAGMSPAMRRTLLAAVSGAAKTKARTDRMYENTMLAALKHGIPQTVVAAAAGCSQAHVSRTLSAARRADEDRRAARRSKRAKSGEQV